MELLHDPAQAIAFVTFSAVAAGTPGPSNTLLAAIGARAGIRHGQAVSFGTLFTLTAMPSCFPWLAFGAALQRYQRTPAPSASSTPPWLPCWPPSSVILFLWPRF